MKAAVGHVDPCGHLCVTSVPCRGCNLFKESGSLCFVRQARIATFTRRRSGCVKKLAIDVDGAAKTRRSPSAVVLLFGSLADHGILFWRCQDSDHETFGYVVYLPSGTHGIESRPARLLVYVSEVSPTRNTGGHRSQVPLKRMGDSEDWAVQASGILQMAS